MIRPYERGAQNTKKRKCSKLLNSPLEDSVAPIPQMATQLPLAAMTVQNSDGLKLQIRKILSTFWKRIFVLFL